MIFLLSILSILPSYKILDIDIPTILPQSINIVESESWSWWLLLYLMPGVELHGDTLYFGDAGLQVLVNGYPVNSLSHIILGEVERVELIRYPVVGDYNYVNIVTKRYKYALPYSRIQLGREPTTEQILFSRAIGELDLTVVTDFVYPERHHFNIGYNFKGYDLRFFYQSAPFVKIAGKHLSAVISKDYNRIAVWGELPRIKSWLGYTSSQHFWTLHRVEFTPVLYMFGRIDYYNGWHFAIGIGYLPTFPMLIFVNHSEMGTTVGLRYKYNEICFNYPGNWEASRISIYYQQQEKYILGINYYEGKFKSMLGYRFHLPKGFVIPVYYLYPKNVLVVELLKSDIHLYACIGDRLTMGFYWQFWD